jgi:hypothetical protein
MPSAIVPAHSWQLHKHNIRAFQKYTWSELETCNLDVICIFSGRMLKHSANSSSEASIERLDYAPFPNNYKISDKFEHYHVNNVKNFQHLRWAG